jgi:DNA-binding Lrp family transcriptional regulator
MVEAYLLINCDSGMAGMAAKKMSEQEGIKSAKIVTGLHDIVALVESENLSTLATQIVDKIQKVEGVGRTVTMVCVDI